jgi:hypothetical protein
VTQHFVVAKLCRRKGERLTNLIMYTIRVCITLCDSSSHRNSTGLPGDCGCALLPCGGASFKLGELVRGPGVDHELQLKTMPGT